MKKLKFCLSFLLTLALIMGVIPKTTIAATSTTPLITATSDQTITIVKPITPAQEATLFTQDTYDLAIDHDFAQYRTIGIKNNLAVPYEYYLTCENVPADLAMGFIKAGSELDPVLIDANATSEVELAIFAQNAKQRSYTFNVKAYQVVNGTSTLIDEAVINLSVTSGNLTVDCTLTSDDPTTLAKTMTLRNIGDTNISDTTVSLNGEVANYVSFNPYIQNLPLAVNETVTFKMSPDLSKMKRNNIKLLTGNIVISGLGQTKEFPITFDVGNNEIIDTTLGELALINDGNPFVNLQIDETSITPDSNNYSNQNEAQVAVNYDLTCGINGEETSPSRVVMNVSNEIDNTIPENGVTTVTNENGKLVINYKGHLTQEQYNLFMTSSNSQQSLLSLTNGISTLAAEPSIPPSQIPMPSNEEGLGISVIIEFAGFIEEVGSKETGEPSGVVNALSLAYTLPGIASDTWNTLSVLSNPNIPINVRNQYAELQITKNFLTGVAAFAYLLGPLGAVIAGIAVAGVNYGLSEYQNYLLDPNDKGFLLNVLGFFFDIFGYQCTNVGSITSNFYPPSYVSADKSKTSMYYTGRMYGKGGAWGEDLIPYKTNYDYLLNGQKVTSDTNPGLGELSMTKIPTDYLNFGEKNTIVRDYDTYPGHDFFSTENEIIIMYPSDTEVSFVTNPENLPDVRLLPDFAVYPENIYFSEKNPIINVPTKIKFNYYNKGVQSGYYTLKVYVNNQLIKSIENDFLQYFSSKQLELDWTPTQANNEIRIELINKSIGLDERKTDNNIATKTITARQRVVPVISSVAPTGIVGNIDALSAVVAGNDDVTNVQFYLNYALENGVVQKALLPDGNTKYWISISPLVAGNYTVEAYVYYKQAYGEALISSSSNFTVQNINPLDPTNPIDDGIRFNQYQTDITSYVNSSFYPSFSLYKEGYPNNYLNTNDYLSKIIVTITQNDTIIQRNSTSDLSFNALKAGTAKVKLEYNNQSIEFNVTIKSAEEAPGCLINLQYPSPNAGYLYMQILRKDSYAGRWYIYGANAQKISNNQYKFLFTSSDIVTNPQNYLYSFVDNGRLFYGKLNSTSVTVTDTGLKKLSFKQVPGLTVTSISVAYDPDNDGVKTSVNVSGTNIAYLPPGSYDVSVSFIKDNVIHSYISTLNISADVEIDLSQEIETKPQTQSLTFTWSSLFENKANGLSIYPNTSNGTTPSLNFYSYSKGEKVYISEGQYNTSLYLINSNVSYEFINNTSVPANSDKVINIGDTFTGTISYNNLSQPQISGNNLSFSALNCLDANGNELDYFYGRNGTAKVPCVFILTNINNPTDVIQIPFESENLHNMKITLPDVEGSYTGKLLIYSGTVTQTQTYTITATAVVGGTTTGTNTYNENSLVTLTATANAGYVFDGWYENNVKINGANATYQFNAIANRTLEARFVQSNTSYTVTFDTGNGSAITPLNISSGSFIPRPSNPTSDNKLFVEWYKDPALTNVWLFDEDTVTNNAQLYAKWIDAPSVNSGIFKAIIDPLNRGEITIVDVTAGGTITKPSDPIRTGYTFGGWYADYNCTIPWDFSSVVTSSMTLYSKWLKVQSIPSTPVILTPPTANPILISDPFVYVGTLDNTPVSNPTNTTAIQKDVKLKNAVIYASDKTLNIGDKFVFMEGVTARDNGGKGKDLTKRVTISGTINTLKAGSYPITYKVKGANGKTVTKIVTITVK